MRKSQQAKVVSLCRFQHGFPVGLQQHAGRIRLMVQGPLLYACSEFLANVSKKMPPRLESELSNSRLTVIPFTASEVLHKGVTARTWDAERIERKAKDACPATPQDGLPCPWVQANVGAGRNGAAWPARCAEVRRVGDVVRLISSTDTNVGDLVVHLKKSSQVAFGEGMRTCVMQGIRAATVQATRR